MGVDVMKISPDLCEVSVWAGAECNNCSRITSSVYLMLADKIITI